MDAIKTSLFELFKIGPGHQARIQSALRRPGMTSSNQSVHFRLMQIINP